VYLIILVGALRGKAVKNTTLSASRKRKAENLARKARFDEFV
jgi:hypothetical protein